MTTTKITEKTSSENPQPQEDRKATWNDDNIFWLSQERKAFDLSLNQGSYRRKLLYIEWGLKTYGYRGNL